MPDKLTLQEATNHLATCAECRRIFREQAATGHIVAMRCRDDGHIEFVWETG